MTDLTDAHIDLWVAAMRFTGGLQQDIDAALKSHGLPTLAIYDLLLEIWRAGEHGIRPVEMQQRLLISQYNLSRHIARLVDAGWVARHTVDEDGRGQLLTLTPAGQDLRARMWEIYRASLHDALADGIAADEAAVMAEHLRNITDNLARE